MKCRLAYLAVPFLAACAEGLGPTGETYLFPDASGPLDGAAHARETDAGDAAVSAADATSGDVSPPPPPQAEAGSEAGVVVTPPVVDGTIAPGEYGDHTDGKNQQTSNSGGTNPAAWFMTWDDTNLYIGVTHASVVEGVILYVDANPLPQLEGGTVADGSLAGQPYDGVVASLPLRADFVAYVKSTYNEYRSADGSGGWSAPTAGAIVHAESGTSREVAIPWALVHASGRPASFAWVGYVVSSSSRWVYAQMPVPNPGGAVGANDAFTHAYLIGNATPGSGDKPFASVVVP
jgi:hypothetical protein